MSHTSQVVQFMNSTAEILGLDVSSPMFTSSLFAQGLPAFIESYQEQAAKLETLYQSDNYTDEEYREESRLMHRWRDLCYWTIEHLQETRGDEDGFLAKLQRDLMHSSPQNLELPPCTA